MRNIKAMVERDVQETLHGETIKRLADRLGIEFHYLADWWEWKRAVSCAIEERELPLSRNFLERRFGCLGAIAYRLTHDF